MNCIVLDLEWNQASCKLNEKPGLTFEIIEIGAVRLGRDGRITDTFSRLIRPVVYPKLFERVKAVVKLTNEQLQREGAPFAQVLEDFMRWCGPDPVFFTWGNMDLTELQKNIAYYDIPNPFEFPLFYYDVQKLYGIQMLEEKARVSLEQAAMESKLSSDTAFHRAVNDAEYTARILRLLDEKRWKPMISVDYFRPPMSSDEEIYIVFDRYSKLVSQVYESRDKAMEARNISSTVCYKCRCNVRKRLGWFCDNGKNYFSLSWCPRHGWLKGKIRMKHYEGGVFAVKTMKLVSEEDAQKVRIRYQNIKRKNYLKRCAEQAEQEEKDIPEE